MEIQPAADILQDFLAECEVKLMQFAPQNISNMLWACATLGISPGTSSAATKLGFATNSLSYVSFNCSKGNHMHV